MTTNPALDAAETAVARLLHRTPWASNRIIARVALEAGWPSIEAKVRAQMIDSMGDSHWLLAAEHDPNPTRRDVDV